MRWHEFMRHRMRRGLLTWLVLVWSMQFAIGQQASKTYRIAIVSVVPVVEMIAESRDPFFQSLFNELRRLGYVEGQNHNRVSMESC